MKCFLKQPTLYLATFIISSSAGCNDFRNRQAQPDATNTEQNPPQVATQPNDPSFVTEVAQKVGSAVVRIDATRTVNVPGSGNPLIERFFGTELPQQRVQRGIGSGFIISEDGRILTNAHVVEGADRVTVVLREGKSFAGKVVGADKVTDVAVIDIEANGLPTVEPANPDSIVVGQWANASGTLRERNW